MRDLTRLYHHLPYPWRVVVASARGYYLRWWRYGSQTERFIEEALERESWSPTRWATWQEERLAFVLHRAATQVPYYRRLWTERRRSGDQSSWEMLENWPVLEKESVRAQTHAFVAEDCDVHRMFRNATSGTTGTPLHVYLRRETLQQWYALYEARIRGWHGVSIHERWAIMGGQLVVSFDQQKPPFWVYNAGLNQLYLSTHHLSRRNAPHYAEALKRFAPTHLVVYPSSANVLATYLLEQDVEIPSVAVVFSNAERLFDRQKQRIEQAFDCPVRNTYGMGEIIVGASECGQGTMHRWPEVGRVEILDEQQDRPVAEGTTGRIVATGLLNADMPLIRYEVGDRARRHAAKRMCGCGRKLPALGSLEGRTNDLIITPDGRQVFWLNPVFYGLPLQEAQIVQEALEHLRVRVVPTVGYTSSHGQTIAARLHDRVGEMDISVEVVDAIERTDNGKLRSVVSKISLDQEPI